MNNEVTLSEKDRKKYTKIGNNLIKQKYVTGFQLEDFEYDKDKYITYGHDNNDHITIIQSNVDGKVYPRESLYKWNKEWEPGVNTQLLNNKTLASEKGIYLKTSKIDKAKKYFKRRTFNNISKDPIMYSWDVPDIRIYNSKKTHRNYKKAYNITKKIDKDTRMSMIVTSKSKMKKIRKKLKYERVKKIKVQNYPKNSSFYDFISG